MFDGLKKKLSDAVKGFIKKEEPVIEERQVEEAKKEEKTQEQELTPMQHEQTSTEGKQETVQSVAEAKTVEAPPSEPKHTESIAQQEKPAEDKVHLTKEEHKPAQQRVEKIHKQEHKIVPEQVPALPEPQTRPQESKPVQRREQKEEKIVKVSLSTKIKSILTSSVYLNDNEIESFIENIRLPLLESDVSYETTEAFLESLKTNLKQTKVDSKNINSELVRLVRQSLFEVLAKSGNGVNVTDFVKEKLGKGEAPVRILFLGPNGTGKTTTMAKIAYKFKKDGISSVLSASDTFRAAAIEQTEHHANKVGVPVIKSKYGADPASIAFDAVAYAKAHNIQAVLIDSAGRQETNKNLINEMQKMVRVAKPDLIIFVGESIAGNQLSEQVKEFSKFLKIDGIILTKLDADVKGGNAISIAYTTGIPLLYFGTGESYEALVQYTPDFIVDAIMPNN